MAWLFIAVTVLGTVYGQLVLKWQVDRAGALPDTGAERVGYAVGLLLNPWVISAFLAAAIAALSWIAALSRFELSKAYPFVGLTFVTTLLAGVVLFGEELSAPKVVGTLVVVAGVIIASQG